MQRENSSDLFLDRFIEGVLVYRFRAYESEHNVLLPQHHIRMRGLPVEKDQTLSMYYKKHRDLVSVIVYIIQIYTEVLFSRILL